MMAAFRQETGMEAAQTSDLAVRLYAVAAQIQALYVQADWVGRQCFPQSAEGEFLDRHAVLRGLERRAANRAEGVLRFSVDASGGAQLSIPAGTVCMTAGLVRFETTQDAAIYPGELYAEARARAVEPGTAGNAAAGAILTMAVAPVGVSRCVNPAAFTGGTDREEDEALRARVLETFRRMPNGANAAFYHQGAMSFPQVAGAAVIPRPRGVGSVDVVIATSAGVPDGALLTQVADYFQSRREIAVDVQVKAPTVRTVDVVLQVAPAEGWRLEDAAAAVRQAVEALFDGTMLGRSVLRARLVALALGLPGVANCAVTAPSADVAVGAAELPRLGVLTVTGMEG